MDRRATSAKKLPRTSPVLIRSKLLRKQDTSANYSRVPVRAVALSGSCHRMHCEAVRKELEAVV